MNKSIDILVYEFRQKLTENTNESSLPLPIKAMIIKELYDAVSTASNQQLSKQLNALKTKSGMKSNDEQE